MRCDVSSASDFIATGTRLGDRDPACAGSVPKVRRSPTAATSRRRAAGEATCRNAAVFGTPATSSTVAARSRNETVCFTRSPALRPAR